MKSVSNVLLNAQKGSDHASKFSGSLEGYDSPIREVSEPFEKHQFPPYGISTHTSNYARYNLSIWRFSLTPYHF
jgi:hypothetical protein